MALYEIHSCGIAHRDVKADNVVLLRNLPRQDVDIVLLDFAFCETLGDHGMRDAYVRRDASG